MTTLSIWIYNRDTREATSTPIGCASRQPGNLIGWEKPSWEAGSKKASDWRRRRAVPFKRLGDWTSHSQWRGFFLSSFFFVVLLYFRPFFYILRDSFCRENKADSRGMEYIYLTQLQNLFIIFLFIHYSKKTQTNSFLVKGIYLDLMLNIKPIRKTETVHHSNFLEYFILFFLFLFIWKLQRLCNWVWLGGRLHVTQRYSVNYHLYTK